MATPSKLSVMISSRCEDIFPPQTGKKMSDIRRSLKKDIEKMEIVGKQSLEVWINEEAPPQGGTWNSWDVCIRAARNCDILLVISNGNAGWADKGGDIGICHAELKTGLDTAPAKVRLISLDPVPIKKNAEGERNKRFQEYLKTQSLFRGGAVNSEEDLKTRVKEAPHDAVISLAQAGVREASRGKFHSGTALDWSHLDFGARKTKMINVLLEALNARAGLASLTAKDTLWIRMDGRDILAKLHAIPAALSVSAARESVGQPFLRDYESAPDLNNNRGGPLHIIACHKTATESQAAKVLGFPDATLVTAPFGVFVADPIQKVQLAFLANCRDETNTRHALQRFMDWLSQTGEESLLADRAQARARIVRAVAKEVKL